ncbi:MAG: hypothetical protein V2I97_24840 [Desulfococcaceae bacterium]|jgi:hypothetical protein|nr:hypothetical protein [Desulfococcaceae bacterium]
MYDLMKKRMEEIKINTHQLSCSCGIPNGYMASLLGGSIQKPGKDKLIQIGLSLYWDIEKINELLAGYGHEEISKKDISFFIKAVENKGVFSGHNPIYPGTLSFAATIMSIERLEGNVRLVTAGYPHVVIGDYSPNYEYDNAEKESIYHYIDEFLFDERKDYFFRNLEKYKITHLICRKCFESEIIRRKSENRENLLQTFRRLFECMRHTQNYELKLIENCPKFEFHLREPNHIYEKPITVFAGSLTRHYKTQDSSLIGFVNNSQELYDIFLHEFNRLEDFAIVECAETELLIPYIIRILEKNGIGHYDDFIADVTNP